MPKGVYLHKPEFNRVRALVLLRKCGISFYSIAKAMGLKDKRNLITLYKRHQNEFFLPNEKLKVGK